jgi:hypothetical protein
MHRPRGHARPCSSNHTPSGAACRLAPPGSPPRSSHSSPTPGSRRISTAAAVVPVASSPRCAGWPRLCSVLRQHCVDLQSKKRRTLLAGHTIRSGGLHDNCCMGAMAPLSASASLRGVVDVGEDAMCDSKNGQVKHDSGEV